MRSRPGDARLGHVGLRPIVSAIRQKRIFHLTVHPIDSIVSSAGHTRRGHVDFQEADPLSRVALTTSPIESLT